MILLTAIRAALEAGKEIMTVYTDPEADFEIEKKADNSPLTIADRKSHAVIAKALQQTPYPLLSEEGKQIPFEERRNWNELWIVDPLDGTKEFIKRNGEFTVNIAFVQNGVPQAGVIYIPVKQELFFADCAYGAYKIGPITELPAETTLDSLMNQGQRLPYAAPRKDFVIVASRSHLTPGNEAMPQAGGNRFEGKFPETLPHCRRRSGCLSALCPNHGMGHRRRTCHHPCRRQRSLSGRQTGTATI